MIQLVIIWQLSLEPVFQAWLQVILQVVVVVEGLQVLLIQQQPVQEDLVAGELDRKVVVVLAQPVPLIQAVAVGGHETA